jgi:hypothetical protein
VGVVTGITLEFQFGTNWSGYSAYVGDIFGSLLAIEATAAFFLESTLIGVWVFGWKKLSRKAHAMVMWLVAGASNLSAIWILTANGWMQQPVGYAIRNGRAELTDFAAVVFNTFSILQILHVVPAALLLAAFFIMGISAYHLLKQQNVDFFSRSFRLGLVAGTDNDATNLSIVMTALAMNPRLFVVARKNDLANRELFDRVGAKVVMHPSTVIAQGIRVRLARPLLSELFTLARFREDAWACELVSRIAALVHDRVPYTWQVQMDEESAYALCDAEARGLPVTLGDLLKDPRDRNQTLPAIPLLLEHNEQRELSPDLGTRVRKGDRLLLCGRQEARRRMDYSLRNINALRYVLTGEDLPEGWVWRQGSRLWRRHRQAPAPIDPGE